MLLCIKNKKPEVQYHSRAAGGPESAIVPPSPPAAASCVCLCCPGRRLPWKQVRAFGGLFSCYRSASTPCWLLVSFYVFFFLLLRTICVNFGLKSANIACRGGERTPYHHHHHHHSCQVSQRTSKVCHKRNFRWK